MYLFEYLNGILVIICHTFVITLIASELTELEGDKRDLSIKLLNGSTLSKSPKARKESRINRDTFLYLIHYLVQTSTVSFNIGLSHHDNERWIILY